MTRWDYQVEAYEGDVKGLEAVLGQRGEEGWELAALLQPDSLTRSNQSMQEAMSNTPAVLHLIFKRPQG